MKRSQCYKKGFSPSAFSTWIIHMTSSFYECLNFHSWIQCLTVLVTAKYNPLCNSGNWLNWRSRSTGNLYLLRLIRWTMWCFVSLVAPLDSILFPHGHYLHCQTWLSDVQTLSQKILPSGTGCLPLSASLILYILLKKKSHWKTESRLSMPVNITLHHFIVLNSI